MRKKFDKALHDKYDTLAKDAAQKIFNNIEGYSLETSKKKIEVDFRIIKDGVHVGYLEVEVKRLWKGSELPFDDVQFPGRKWKYCKLDKPTIFMMFNNELTDYLTVHGEDLLSSKLEMVRNKYVKFGEMFFKVEKSVALFNGIELALNQLQEKV